MLACGEDNIVFANDPSLKHGAGVRRRVTIIVCKSKLWRATPLISDILACGSTKGLKILLVKDGRSCSSNVEKADRDKNRWK